MGNLLPCCGESNEAQKPNAFSAASSHHQPSYPQPQQQTLVYSTNQNASSLDPNSNYRSSSSPSSHLPGVNGNLTDATATADQYQQQLLEQQRLLLLQQEQERLERIVNDAGWEMVHVNGIAGGGGSNSSGMLKSSFLMGGGSALGQMTSSQSQQPRALGYYDANYAAEVWQDLIPGRNGGGGLIAMCQKEMEAKQLQQSQSQSQSDSQPQQPSRSSSSVLLMKQVPKGIGNHDSLESLMNGSSHGGSLGNASGMNGGGGISGGGGGSGPMTLRIWKDDAVRILNELIMEGTNQGTTSYRFSMGDASGNVDGGGGRVSSATGAAATTADTSMHSGTSTTATNSNTETAMNTVRFHEGENMERWVDDLAEKFLATVFQEGRLDGHPPIVENVL